MEKKEQAVISVLGGDHPGILAAAADEVAKNGGNIVNVNQAVMNQFFAMTMIIEIDRLSVHLDELQRLIQARLTDMKVFVMHENIFDAMHTI